MLTGDAGIGSTLAWATRWVERQDPLPGEQKHYHEKHICFTPNAQGSSLVTKESRTARLTVLIDPRKKAYFEALCAEEDATPSQVVRRLIRAYIEERTGQAWRPEEEAAAKKTSRGRRR